VALEVSGTWLVLPQLLALLLPRVVLLALLLPRVVLLACLPPRVVLPLVTAGLAALLGSAGGVTCSPFRVV
jgi:hypothetical protein